MKILTITLSLMTLFSFSITARAADSENNNLGLEDDQIAATQPAAEHPQARMPKSTGKDLPYPEDELKKNTPENFNNDKNLPVDTD